VTSALQVNQKFLSGAGADKVKYSSMEEGDGQKPRDAICA